MISDSRDTPFARDDSADANEDANPHATANAEAEAEEDTRYLEVFVGGKPEDLEAMRTTASEDDVELRALTELANIRHAYGEAWREIGSILVAEEKKPAASSNSEVVAASHFGGYRLVEILGEGGFAKVWRARDERAERDVALKILPDRRELPPEVVVRFLREARALARMNHPHIVRIHHVIEERHALGLCMELVAGETLRSYIERRGRLSADEAALIGADIAGALAEVHRSRFIHRDVKAENIMREDTGRVILMDFGITRALASESRVTATGVLIGTPIVMAPEQYEFKEADERTDIYAVGCLLYRLLAGRAPITGETVEEIRARVLDADYPQLHELRPDLDRKLEAIVHRAMHRRSEKRFDSAAELESALRDWIGEDERRSANTTSSRASLITAGAVVAALLLVIALLLFLLLTRG